MVESLSELIVRDLNRLKDEIRSFDSDESLWQPRPEIKNSAGNLALHICGNLRHFIGHTLGDTSYQRDRNHEFTTTGLTKGELIKLIDVTISEIENTLSPDHRFQLKQPYPIEVFGKPMTNEAFLLHLFGHLNYHLGQVNYYRRLKQ